MVTQNADGSYIFGTLSDRDRLIIRLGGKCVRCGLTDRRVMCIDHINNDGGAERKKFERHGFAAKFHILDIMLADTRFGHGLSKYQLLCHNCNYLKMNSIRRYDPFAKGYTIQETDGRVLFAQKRAKKEIFTPAIQGLENPRLNPSI